MDTFTSNLNPEGFFSAAAIMIITIVDIPIYVCLTWYFEQVWVSQYGTRKPFYFCFTPSFWSGIFCQSQQDTPYEDNSAWSVTTTPNEEDENRTLNGKTRDGSVEELTDEEKQRVAIHVQNLVKTFPAVGGGSVVRAIDGLDLEMLDGQITGLLGHNGIRRASIVLSS